MLASLADYHTHNLLCKHAEGWPTEYARHAADLGLGEIGMSDHSPMPGYFDNWRMLDEEFSTYLQSVEAARENHPQIPVRLGLEVDFFENGGDWIESLATRAPWDYLIGSVHYLGDWAVDDPSLVHRFRDQKVEVVWDRYWTLFRLAAKSGFFDIMAHPDLVKKFGHRPAGDLRRYYEPAVQAIVDAGVAIEINTAGLFKEVHEIYPAPEFLKLAAGAGVPLVISSDAHHPAEVARCFHEAVALARQCGFTHTVRFAQRQRHQVPLPLGE
ncbi:MAG: histidinol-phosphatase HisJ family protein [Verrucomicrobiales bacterium]|nr:histidinol-phosphatase HisJ family protein [Verrucomicrobiales bacterium]